MSNEESSVLAAQWYATQQCAADGRIKIETAAYGLQQLRQTRDKFHIDAAKFEFVVAGIGIILKNKSLPNAKMCNILALQIEDIRLQVNAALTQVETQEQQQRRDVQAQALLEDQRRQDVQAQAQREQQQRRDAQLVAEREQQSRNEEIARRQASQAESAAMSQSISNFAKDMADLNRNSAQFTNSLMNSLPSPGVTFGQPEVRTNCVRVANVLNCKTK